MTNKDEKFEPLPFKLYMKKKIGREILCTCNQKSTGKVRNHGIESLAHAVHIKRQHPNGFMCLWNSGVLSESIASSSLCPSARSSSTTSLCNTDE